MPELPEVQALADFLERTATGHVIARIDVVAINALKTASPPLESALGATVTGAWRRGKFLGLTLESGDELNLVFHLARAGWLQWHEHLSERPLRMSTRNPLAARIAFSDRSGFTLTEQGPKKSLAIYLVRSPCEVAGIANLGPDALAITRTEFDRAIATSHQLKTLLTDQRVISGIGNAYSDEILWAARLSPAKLGNALTAAEGNALFAAMRATLTQATERVAAQKPARLKSEKRSGLSVHGRFGEPCPRCGDTIAHVSLAERDYQYCPACQTKGKRLSDRRMDPMLK